METVGLYQKWIDCDELYTKVITSHCFSAAMCYNSTHYLLRIFKNHEVAYSNVYEEIVLPGDVLFTISEEDESDSFVTYISAEGTALERIDINN